MNVALTLRRARIKEIGRRPSTYQRTPSVPVSPGLPTHPKWRLEYQTSQEIKN